MCAIMTALVLLFGFAPNAGTAESWAYRNASNGRFSGGNGSKSSPYLITEKDKEFKGTYFRLTRDIVLNDITFGTDGYPTSTYSLKEWTPIGKWGFWSDNDFEGDFDGNGHSVSGLYFGGTASGQNYVGLFGSTKNASVRNLTIKDSYSNTTPTCKYNYTGMLIGRATQTVVENCHVTGTMQHLNAEKEKAYFGGLIGICDGSSPIVESSSFGGTIECRDMGAGAYMGGILGLNEATGPKSTSVNIRKCSTTASAKTVLYDECKDGKNHKGDIEGGGIGTCGNNAYISDCVNRMNIYVERRGQHSDDHAWIVYAFDIAVYTNKTSCCANFGNIYFGTEDKTLRRMQGALGFLGKSTNDDVYNSVNYGKLVTNVKSDSYVRLGVICTDPYSRPEGVNCFTVKDECAVTYNGAFGTSVSHQGEKELDELKGDFFVDDLKNKLGSSVWGVYESDDMYNGCPLPISCGGKPKTIGDGTQSNPYAISSEAILREFIQRIKNGKIDTNGKYFRLDTDLDMSDSEPLPAITSKDKPFKGDFDGNGHVISNITLKDNSLFVYNEGSIHGLTMLNVTFDGLQSQCAPIAYCNDGTVEQCSVGGNISMTAPAEGDASLAGLCFTSTCKNSGATIKNCYVKGTLNISGCTGMTTFYGLFAKSPANKMFEINGNYASFDVSGNPDNKKVYGLAQAWPGDKNGMVKPTNCWYVCTGTDVITETNTEKCPLNSDSELNAKFAANTAWLTGANRPVLKACRHYAVNAYGDAATKVYTDAIPATDGSNDIVNCNLGDEENAAYANAPLLFSLSNVAIYNPADKTDYLLFCDLNPDKAFNYTPNPESERQVTGAMTYPLALTGQQGSCRYMLCMPANVYANNLPDGCKLMVAGQTTKDTEFDGNDKTNLIECDSIDAGVPFILYVPETVTDPSLNLIMRGTLKTQPSQAIELPSNSTGHTSYTVGMTGTFKQTDEMGGVCTAIQNHATFGVYSPKGKAAVAPFRAYATPGSDAAGVRFVDYLLLDETSNFTGDIIADNAGNTVNIKLKRSLKENQWNTICLPFDMTVDEIKTVFGEDTKVERLSSADYADGVCALNFAAETEIKAGVAYMLKPSAVNANGVYSLGNKMIYGDEPQEDQKSVDIDGETFILGLYGNYERQLLAGGSDGIGSVNGNVYFIQQDKIYQVASGQTVTMKGFWSYFKASSDKAAQVLSNARMVHSDGTTTSLRLIEVGTDSDGRIYNIQGMEVDEPTHNGVYIKNGRKYVKK